MACYSELEYDKHNAHSGQEKRHMSSSKLAWCLRCYFDYAVTKFQRIDLVRDWEGEGKGTPHLLAERLCCKHPGDDDRQQNASKVWRGGGQRPERDDNDLLDQATA